MYFIEGGTKPPLVAFFRSIWPVEKGRKTGNVETENFENGGHENKEEKEM